MKPAVSGRAATLVSSGSHGSSGRIGVVAALCALVFSCSSPEPGTRSAAERGKALASDPALSGSRFNAWSCTSCHAISAGDPRILPGAPLGGAVRRPSWWGGRALTIGDAVEQCATKFMRAPRLDRGDPKWVDLWAYLESIEGDGPQEAQPFDVVYEIADVPDGDRARGAEIWERACRGCHGAVRTGEGRPTVPGGGASASIVPNETIDFHQGEGPGIVRLVIIEKVRHGSYLGFAGSMPPFSRGALSDADLGALLAYLAPFDRK